MGDYRADRVFFMCAASLEVKSKAPNGVTFNVKGKSAHEGPIAGSVSLFLLSSEKIVGARCMDWKLISLDDGWYSSRPNMSTSLLVKNAPEFATLPMTSPIVDAERDPCTPCRAATLCPDRSSCCLLPSLPTMASC